MYYVIKKQTNKPGSMFMGFAVPKYIASKKNENVIFLFQKDGKVIRKWVKMDEIILLTDNKEYFLEVMEQFKQVEEQQQKLVDEAQKKLEKSMTNFVETMNAQIHDYEEIRDNDDVPCILKDL
jgi:predicted transcriptional regulator